jgi:hypothetical protein
MFSGAKVGMTVSFGASGNPLVRGSYSNDDGYSNSKEKANDQSKLEGTIHFVWGYL